MDFSSFGDYIVFAVLGICMCVGYVVKHSLTFIPDKYIPLITLIIGVVANILANIHHITLNVIFAGMISGLASTGMYEALRNLNKPDKKNDDKVQ